MDALDALMRPVARLLNRSIQDSLTAQALCSELDDRIVGIAVRDTSLSVYFAFNDDIVTLASDAPGEADARIVGSIPGLARLAASGDPDAIRRGDIQLEGDIATVQTFQKLLAFAKPDPEEELSRFIGDEAANQLGNLARSFGEWGRDARDTMTGNLREYLQEESGDVPSRYEVERFGKAVGKLRDDVDRLEARLEQLEAPAS
ncbi:MAG: SCP2 sterol-binding domain-containing protein [Pseudomonadota bacterium]